MKDIPLTRGQQVVVDDEDYEYLAINKWCASKKNNGFYAVRRSPQGRILYMHRYILGLDFGDERKADHRDGNTLDNRRSNLRIVSHADNNRNQRLRNTNTSGYKGVSWSNKRNKWAATITANRKHLYLGCFETKEAAYEAYCVAATEHHKEAACFG